MARERLDIVVTERGSRTVKRNIAGIGRAAKQAKGGVSLLRSALGALSGALILGNITRTIAKFSQSMSTLRAVTGATGESFDSLREKAKQLGIETRFSATQAGDAMVFLARTGFDANQVLATIDGTLQLAQVGMLDVARAADIASNVLKGFRLNVSQMTRVVDVLARTSVETNTTVESLGDAMSFAAAAAAALGVSVEEAAAAIGVLGDAGIPASRAGAGLNLVLSKMVKFTGAAKRAIREMNLDLTDLNVESRGLIPVLQTLADANLDLGQAIDIVGVRQAKTLLIMVESLPRLKEVNQLNEDAAGTAKNLAKIMDDNLNGALLRVKSAFEGLQIALGDAGVEGTLRAVIEKIAIGLRLMARNADTLANGLAILATVITVRLVQGAIALLLPAIATLSAALAAMSATVLPLLAAAAIAAFAGLALAAVSTGQTLDEVFDNLKGSITRAFEGFIEPTQALADFDRRFLILSTTIGKAGGVAKLTVKQLLEVRKSVQGLILDMKATLLLQDFLAPQSAAAFRLRNRIELLKETLDKVTGQLSPTDEDPTEKAKKELPTSTPQFDKFLKDLARENELLRLGNKERAVQRVLDEARNVLGSALSKMQKETVRNLVEENIALERQNNLLDEIIGPTEKYADTISDLNALLARNAITQAQATEKTREARLAFLQTEKTFSAGAERALIKLAIDAEDNAGRMERAITNAFRAAGDALADFVETGKFDFNSLIKSIHRDLIELSIKGAITGPLAKLLSGESLDKEGSGTFGGFGGLIGSIFGDDAATKDKGPFGVGLGGSAGDFAGLGADALGGGGIAAAAATLTAAGTTLAASGAAHTGAAAAITASSATVTAAAATTTASGAALTASAAATTGAAAALTGAAASLAASAAASGVGGVIGGGGGGGDGLIGLLGSVLEGGGGTGFKHGGVVGGGPFGALISQILGKDGEIIKAHKGEVVLNKEQQNALSNMLGLGGGSGFLGGLAGAILGGGFGGGGGGNPPKQFSGMDLLAGQNSGGGQSERLFQTFGPMGALVSSILGDKLKGFAHGGVVGGTPNSGTLQRSSRTVDSENGEDRGGGSTTVHQNWYITTPDIPGFARNENQVLGRGAAAARNVQRRR